MSECCRVLVDLGVPEGIARPPFYRVLWKLGFTPRPSLYSESVISFTVSGLILGAAWGGMMRFSTWDSWGFVNIVASFFFGVTMALFFRWQQRRARNKYSLPSWESVIERVRKIGGDEVADLDG